MYVPARHVVQTVQVSALRGSTLRPVVLKYPAVQAEMRTLYETFKQRVATGRSLTERDVEKAAQGRIWSGERARGLGLVDRLGGPIEALEEVCERAALTPETSYLLEVYPQRRVLPGLSDWVSSLASVARHGHVGWE